MNSDETAKEGAVLVVGGGIGGIQAAIDLADSGFYVYLVEESSAIGGRINSTKRCQPTTAPCACSRPSWWKPGGIIISKFCQTRSCSM